MLDKVSQGILLIFEHVLDGCLTPEFRFHFYFDNSEVPSVVSDV